MKRLFPVLALLAFAGCGDDPTDPGVAAFITAVAGGGATVTVVNGTPPAKMAGMPDPQIFASDNVTPGTNLQVEISAAGIGFTEMYVQIVGMERYYRLELPASVSVQIITISLAPDIPVSNFTFIFGLGASYGYNYGGHFVSVN